MDWLAPLSALMGAVIGAGSTLMAQRSQWRRETAQRDRDARRQLFGAYLTAHYQSGEALWALAQGVHRPDGETYLQAAHRAFNPEALYPLRAQIIVFASGTVGESTQRALSALRRLRDCIADEKLAGTEEYARAYASARESQHKLRDTMRSDLGVEL